MNEVQILYLRDAAALYGEGLDYATSGSAGMDLRACLEAENQSVGPGERLAVPTGIAVDPGQDNVAGFVYSRSGLGAVKGLTVAQGVGLIDPDYRGEITVFLLNTSNETRTISRGERIAQLVFQPFVRLRPLRVQSLSETDRGAGGFGHTGKG